MGDSGEVVGPLIFLSASFDEEIQLWSARHRVNIKDQIRSKVFRLVNVTAVVKVRTSSATFLVQRNRFFSHLKSRNEGGRVNNCPDFFGVELNETSPPLTADLISQLEI